MDIVERLRKPVSKDDPYICTNTDIQPEIKYDLLRSQAADEIEQLREKNAWLRELLQKWLGNCFVDVYGHGVSFGMGVRKVWAETRAALKEGE